MDEIRSQQPQDQLQGVSIDISRLITTLQLGNQQSAAIVNQLKTRFAAQAATETKLATAYSTAGGTLISSDSCYLVSISVTTASTGTTGLCYDSAAILNAGSTNTFAVIPSSGILTLNWPCLNGLVIQPSSQGTHTVSVSFVP